VLAEQACGPDVMTIGGEHRILDEAGYPLLGGPPSTQGPKKMRRMEYPSGLTHLLGGMRLSGDRSYPSRRRGRHIVGRLVELLEDALILWRSPEEVFGNQSRVVNPPSVSPGRSPRRARRLTKRRSIRGSSILSTSHRPRSHTGVPAWSLGRRFRGRVQTLEIRLHRWFRPSIPLPGVDSDCAVALPPVNPKSASKTKMVGVALGLWRFSSHNSKIQNPNRESCRSGFLLRGLGRYRA